MVQAQSSIMLRKSIATLIIKISILQALVVLIYMAIRISKLWVFKEFFFDNDYHDLNFWLGISVFVLIIISQTVILVAIVLQWFNEFYKVNKTSIVHTRGVFHRKEDIYSLKTVESGSVMQTLLGKLLNYGTVKIYSPVLKREYFLTEISDPQNIRDMMISLMTETKSKNEKIIPKELS